ncbi:MAG: hypothetical protein INF75_04590 [Roseomonas sp.]|nr:hypothetical protein [Roseomonas sp.]MCA3328190.1 hypothetical protein [Roseomonas sp.]MCA3331289.1 hypothetical protein [Roseomonas sp.]MCA3335959.1 hypothetical protein [Roseomonas sp.]MCA3352889.1 hypothetical protein [Roseomonas sp.]
MAHGSNSDTLESRLEQFCYCLKQLTAVLEPTRFLMGSPGRIAHEQVEPVQQGVTGDIMVVTVPANNLIAEIAAPLSLNAQLWSGEPRQLGYQCRRVFAQHVGRYDFYLFIEDDTTIFDPSFFRKIAAFYRTHGEDKILLPNRFEIFGPRHHGWRAYLDQPAFPNHRAPERPGPAELTLQSFDGDVLFRKTRDSLSGAYIITDGQLRSWMVQPDFHAPDPAAVAAGLDPLELTQTPLGGSLPIYRPAPPNLDFLEVHHVPNRLSALKSPSEKLRAYIHQILRERLVRMQATKGQPAPEA